MWGAGALAPASAARAGADPAARAAVPAAGSRGTATGVPGLAALNKGTGGGNAAYLSVSCAPAGPAPLAGPTRRFRSQSGIRHPGRIAPPDPREYSEEYTFSGQSAVLTFRHRLLHSMTSAFITLRLAHLF